MHLTTAESQLVSPSSASLVLVAVAVHHRWSLQLVQGKVLGGPVERAKAKQLKLNQQG